MSVRSVVAGLRPAERALVVVDVLLVLVLVVLLVALRGGGDDGASVSPTTASPAPTAAGPTLAPEPEAFELPTGNIACEVAADGVRCTIGSFTYAPPPVEGCDAPTGHVVRLDGEGFRFECETDGVPAVETLGEQLAYGSKVAVGDWTCASGTDGVTCTGADGTGFRLARAAWVTLP